MTLPTHDPSLWSRESVHADDQGMTACPLPETGGTQPKEFTGEDRDGKGTWVFIFILALIALLGLFTSGCARMTSAEQCTQDGFRPGTEAMAICIAGREGARAQWHGAVTQGILSNPPRRRELFIAR